MTKPLSACMHATYVRNKFDKSQDVLVVKRRVLDPVTKQERPVLDYIPNYERPFWVTKKAYRNEHKQKREYEFIEKCNEYRSSQAMLANTIKKVLGKHGEGGRLKQLCRSPYVYGTDVSPAVLYKHEDDKRAEQENGSWRPNFTIAVADYETDVVNGTEQIISGAIASGETVFIVVTAEFLGLKDVNKNNIEDLTQEQYRRFMAASDKHLKKHIADINLKVKLKIVPNAYQCARYVMLAAHKLMPDLLVFWNMQFDIEKMLDACKLANKCPTTIFCDPACPPEYRVFDWSPDELTKIKADGTVHRKHPAELWNVVTCPASFYIIDAMVVFKMLRVVEGMRQSYSLDAILKEMEVGGKLRIPEAEGKEGLEWHRYMQRNAKIEYLLYNSYDVISVLQLDKKTKDLEQKIAMYADGTELSKINSNPRRLTNSLHFFLHDQGKVPCASSDNMKEDDDDELLGRDGWVVTLANELATGTGTKVFLDEWGEFISRISTHVADIDISSGYPSTQLVMNMSKSTTLVEVCGIFGHDEETQRRIGVNLTYIPANAIDITQTLMGMPKLEWWVDEASESFGVVTEKYGDDTVSEDLTNVIKKGLETA